jgi:alkanesulfonate monooxygenase SsuD/methylene tetrahydromethanopterin reductase-like flavin-dependent oxidoreductase (luciferase family)
MALLKSSAPCPRLWIGGSGEKVTLKLVVQFGDACNLGGDLETLRHKLNVLRGHCENVGRDYETIVKSHTINVVVGSDKAEADRIVTEFARRMGEDPEAVRSQFGAFLGPPEHVAVAIQGVVDLGFEYIIVDQPNMAEVGVIQGLAEQVIPLVRPAARVAG